MCCTQTYVADFIVHILNLKFNMLEDRLKLHVFFGYVLHLAAKLADLGHFVAVPLHFFVDIHYFDIYLIQVCLLDV
jgi:hypothetical protein